MKTLTIFLRDLKVSLREFVTFLLMAAPIFLALLVRLVSPGLSDTPLTLAVVAGENPRQAAYLGQFVAVEELPSEAALKERVLARDDVMGLLAQEGGYAVVIQGSEPAYLVTAAKALLTYWQEGVAGTPPVFHSFERTAPPLKITLTTSLLVLVTILSGMLISINIVDEKADKTLKAIRVAPVSIGSFVVGKSLIGVLNSVVCGLFCVLAAGFANVNLAQVLLAVLCASFISFAVGFLTGLTSEDFISAAGSMKLLMIPALAPVLVYELAASRWQFLVWWSPFYWAYDAIKGVLSQTIGWARLGFDAAIVIAITLVLYVLLYPKFRKELA